MQIVRVPNPPDFPSYPPRPGGSPPPPQYVQTRPVLGDGQPYRSESFWKKFFGPLAGVGVLIVKFFAQVKFLLLPILKFLPLILKSGGSMLLMIGVYAVMFGWKWAVGFVVLLLVHETGHLIVARWFGLKVGAPIFIPFMGAFIALKEAPRNAWMEASVGIGGPILGTLGAVACHALGLVLDSPLLISIAYTGYFLNLFNLTPLGQLDGGRIAVALSPWLWLPGLAIMAWFAWQHPNFIVLMILIISVPQVINLFRKRTEEQQRYFEVTPVQRGLMASMYIGLIVFLLVAMHAAHENLWLRPEMQQRHPAVATTPATDRAADGPSGLGASETAVN
jgi:Zn-dependent protease